MYHKRFWKENRENPKRNTKRLWIELWLLDDEGSSWIWGEIRLEQKWVWTLERMGENGGRRLRIFVEREEITLGEDSKISEEDPPLWIGDSKIRIGGYEENLETWEKTHYFIKLKSEYKYVSQGLIYYGPKHQNTQHN